VASGVGAEVRPPPLLLLRSGVGAEVASGVGAEVASGVGAEVASGVGAEVRISYPQRLAWIQTQVLMIANSVSLGYPVI